MFLSLLSPLSLLLGTSPQRTPQSTPDLQGSGGSKPARLKGQRKEREKGDTDGRMGLKTVLKLHTSI